MALIITIMMNFPSLPIQDPFNHLPRHCNVLEYKKPKEERVKSCKTAL